VRMMTHSSHKRLVAGLLACGALLAVAALVALAQKPKRVVPYTVTWQMTEYYRDGRVVQTYTETRSNYSDGNWRSVVRFPNGRAVERVAEAGGGVFGIDPKTGERRYQTPFPERLAGDAKRHPKWARTEQVAGYDVEVLRFEQDGKSHELYHAPALNNDIIKTVYRDQDVTRVLEPISVKKGEPPR
jgi:hypothetical protein